MTKTIRLIPSPGERARFHLTKKPLRYTFSGVAAGVLIASGIASGPSVATFAVEGWNGLQRTASASGPEQHITERSTIDTDWVALIDERATARAIYSALDVTALPAEHNDLIVTYTNAQTRADVLIENGTRDEEAILSATTELRNSLAAIEYALNCEAPGDACESG